jgi:glycosyltransferase involved in cell wall biosynthesis
VKWPLSWIYALESKRLAAYEKRIAEIFDHCIFVTGAEVKVFKGRNPYIENISVITNGVDLDYFSPSFSGSSITHLQSNDLHSTVNDQNSTIDISNSTLNTQYSILHSQSPTPNPQTPMLVFTGAMDYYANIDGVIWFVKEIFPLIKEKVPEVEFYVVGSKPTREVIRLGNYNGIKVTGYVPDTREYFHKANAVVVPLRIAQGIQNKILEPMAMGIPVVATPIAFQGIEATKDRDLIVEGEAEKFANAVIKLLGNVHIRKQFSGNARRTIENNYNWIKNLAKFDSILEGGVIPKPVTR